MWQEQERYMGTPEKQKGEFQIFKIRIIAINCLNEGGEEVPPVVMERRICLSYNCSTGTSHIHQVIPISTINIPNSTVTSDAIYLKVVELFFVYPYVHMKKVKWSNPELPTSSVPTRMILITNINFLPLLLIMLPLQWKWLRPCSVQQHSWDILCRTIRITDHTLNQSLKIFQEEGDYHLQSWMRYN